MPDGTSSSPAASAANPHGTSAEAADALLTPREAEVARLYKARWAASAIADKLGISISAVYDYASKARRKGIDLPLQDMPGAPRKLDWRAVTQLARDGVVQKQIAASLGITERAVSKILHAQRQAGVNVPAKPRRGPAPTVDYEAVKALYLDPLTLPTREIARRLGCKEATVHDALNAMRAQGEHIPYRCRTKAAIAALPQKVEAPTVVDPVPTRLCMCCRKPADIVDPPRWFVCTDCKERDGAPIITRRAA
ncbi:helix-turn-helix domain-containing protein [Roseomonas indoligenes]|uniref:Uncharacterized protein n=1 Tax=Roseomonas indoligenes TaxID=2820811 RepID=A0A940N0R9_9PROT|nr:helix-turn-helix domain-containing protein [Pararoseomonas indoligenes]MBP0492202.1 hypothetical protein [Pararoseomonas indoligenes]